MSILGHNRSLNSCTMCLKEIQWGSQKPKAMRTSSKNILLLQSSSPSAIRVLSLPYTFSVSHRYAWKCAHAHTHTHTHTHTLSALSPVLLPSPDVWPTAADLLVSSTLPLTPHHCRGRAELFLAICVPALQGCNGTFSIICTHTERATRSG